MHIPDGFLSLPVSSIGLAITLGYGTFASLKVKISNAPLIAASASFIFAAQMLNFPVVAGASGHFLGATFATLLFGPLVAFFMLTSVLLIQAFFFGDGGLLALGCNIFNMGIVAPLVAWGVYQVFFKLIKKMSVAVFFASLISVFVTSLVCALEICLSGVAEASKVFPLMGAIHLAIGLGEGVITVIAYNFVKRFEERELEHEMV